MKTFDKYIYKSMTAPIIFGISLFTFIFVIDVLTEMMESILVKNVPVQDVLELVAFSMPPLIMHTTPIGVLLGIMITYGSLSSNSEITAMESVGIGLIKFIQPAVTVGFLFFIITFVMEETVIPEASNKFSYTTKKIAYKKPSMEIEEKVFKENISGYTFYPNYVDTKNNSATNIILFNKNESESVFPQIVVADTAFIDNASIYMESGKFYNIENSGIINLKGGFESKTIPIEDFFSAVEPEKSKTLEGMGLSELYKKLNDAKAQKLPFTDLDVEFNLKLSLPFTSLLLSIMGVLLALGNKRSGKGMSFGVSILVFFLYLSAIQFGRAFASQNTQIPAWICMWYPNIFLALFISILFIMKVKKY